jgi:pimeloyl-ACP methyl ester carboxylesterase
MQKHYTTLLLTLLLSMGSWTVKADILVLIHGYQSNAYTWQQQGIVQQLAQHNWVSDGVLTYTVHGLQHQAGLATAETKNRTIQVNLPSEATLTRQADTLSIMLDQLRLHHPQEKLILVGHSAGGVVARMSLVRHDASQTKALITLASPHLGTDLAEKALNFAHDKSPMSMMSNFFAAPLTNNLRRSTGILLDLRPARSGSILYDLNIQQHPDIEYISIVHRDNSLLSPYEIVPEFSQDMRNVPALAAKAHTLIVPSEHELNWRDAGVILHVLAQLDKQ